MKKLSTFLSNNTLDESSLISKVAVPKGSIPIAPIAQLDEWTFNGWDKQITQIFENTEYHAKWKRTICSDMIATAGADNNAEFVFNPPALFNDLSFPGGYAIRHHVNIRSRHLAGSVEPGVVFSHEISFHMRLTAPGSDISRAKNVDLGPIIGTEKHDMLDDIPFETDVEKMSWTTIYGETKTGVVISEQGLYRLTLEGGKNAASKCDVNWRSVITIECFLDFV